MRAKPKAGMGQQSLRVGREAGKATLPGRFASPRRSTTCRRPRAAFTLVELLTVMIIIGLLAAILLPTVTSALKSGYFAKTLAQRKNLGDGAENYAQDHGGFYPGQDDDTHYTSYKGSQILAACLFDYDITDADPEPTGKYAACKEEYLVNLEVSGTDTRNRTLSDMFPPGKDLAFCYWAYRSGSFHYDDNDVYTGMTGGTSGDFTNFILDARFDNTPRNQGRFILIAPGSDREYFTADDVRNW